jgi:hypothetical protein
VIHEDAPHHLRRDAEELRAVLPLCAVLIDQPQVGFVNECGRLQRVIGALTPQVGLGPTMEVLVDQRDELIASRGISGAPRVQECRHVGLGVHRPHPEASGPGQSRCFRHPIRPEGPVDG